MSRRFTLPMVALLLLVGTSDAPARSGIRARLALPPPAPVAEAERPGGVLIGSARSLERWASEVRSTMDGWLTWRWRSGPAGRVVQAIDDSAHRVWAWLGGAAEDEARLRARLRVLTTEPVAGERTSNFGWRRDPFHRKRRFHHGIDYQAPHGTEVRAAGPGVVRTAERRRGYGRLVILDHGLGLETRYAHLRRIHVEEGAFVPAGALLGEVGSTGRATGPHLHFEVRRDGRALDPTLAFADSVPATSLSEVVARWWQEGSRLTAPLEAATR